MSNPGSRLRAFLESDNVKEIMEDKDLEIRDMVSKFLPVFHQDVKDYVLEHLDEFHGDTLEEIFESIKQFSADCLLSVFSEMDTYIDRKKVA
jgi:hypothetical protein